MWAKFAKFAIDPHFQLLLIENIIEQLHITHFPQRT